jgi:hypothetical protein
MGKLFRVLIGYAVACLILPLVLLGFANSMPGENLFDGDVLSAKLPLIALHVAVFGFPFALAAIAYGEYRRRNDWLYYAIAGIVLSMIGFFAFYMNEGPGSTWSIANSNFPLIAFITSGFAAGIAYWLISGRLVGAPMTKPQPSAGRPGGPDLSRKPGSGNRPNPQRS